MNTAQFILTLCSAVIPNGSSNDFKAVGTNMENMSFCYMRVSNCVEKDKTWSKVEDKIGDCFASAKDKLKEK